MSSTALSRPKRSYSDPWQQRSREAELSLGNMHDYQRMGCKALTMAEDLTDRGFALFVDMGLGKTVMTITALYQIYAASRDMSLGGKVLIIGPGKVINNTWPEELRKWEQGCLFDFSIIHGARDDRIAAASVDRDIYMVTRDNIEWLVEHHGRDWPYRRVIIDESSSFKDPATNRFKALVKILPRVRSVWELTASPSTEGYEGLFAQTYLMDRGARFGKHVTKYREAYFNENRYTHKRTLKAGADEQILEKIQDICLTLKAEDHLPRDKPTVVDWHVNLSPKSLALYRDMEEKQLVEVDGAEISTDAAAQTWLKLTQLASGFIYNGYIEYDEQTDAAVKQRDTHEVHDEKIQVLLEHLAEIPDENVIIAYWFQPTRDKILKALGKKAQVMDKDGKLKKQWDAGKVKYLLLHPASGGHGLNLQKGGRRIIFYDIPAPLELYEQIIGRLDRQGQDLCVFVHHLIARGTVDEGAVTKLKLKESVQDWFYHRLKRLQAKRKRQIEKAAQEAL